MSYFSGLAAPIGMMVLMSIVIFIICILARVVANRWGETPGVLFFVICLLAAIQAVVEFTK